PSAHCIRALALAAAALSAPAPTWAQAVAPEAGSANFMFFLRNIPIGTEQISVARTADGWTITSTGRLAAPIDAVARKIEVRYTGDWRPLRFSLDGVVRGVPQAIDTSIEGSSAKSRMSSAGVRSEKTDTIDPNAVLLLPNSFWGPFEAVA